MTDNEIIKALEKEIHLVEYFDGFSADIVGLELLKNTLDLIKRQQTEIEVLKRNNRVTQRLLSEAWESIEEKDKWFEKRELIAKSEAITEFAERLKREVDMISYETGFEYQETVETIDNLVKKMTEDNNE